MVMKLSCLSAAGPILAQWKVNGGVKIYLMMFDCPAADLCSRAFCVILTSSYKNMAGLVFLLGCWDYIRCDGNCKVLFDCV